MFTNRGFFPGKPPGWLLNIVQTWHKPCKLDPNFVQILSKPKVAGLSDTNRPNLTKFGQTRCEPGANLSRPLHWQVQRQLRVDRRLRVHLHVVLEEAAAEQGQVVGLALLGLD